MINIPAPWYLVGDLDDPGAPHGGSSIGDVRITYQTVGGGPVTVLAVQQATASGGFRLEPLTRCVSSLALRSKQRCVSVNRMSKGSLALETMLEAEAVEQAR